MGKYIFSVKEAGKMRFMGGHIVDVISVLSHIFVICTGAKTRESETTHQRRPADNINKPLSGITFLFQNPIFDL